MHRLPKIELHLHLDCALSGGAAARLRPDWTPDEYRRQIVAPEKCLNSEVYFDCTRRGVALMQSEAALRLIVEDLFDQLARDGVIYAELRFAPLLHTQGGLTPREVVATVAGAMRQQCARTGIEARLILAALRFFTLEQSLQTADLVIEFADRGVAAFDIAGNEELYPIDAHLPAFSRVHAAGLPFTVHAGEGQGAASVWDVMHKLHPRRIGHGVRAASDPALLSLLSSEGVHLEICPTTNVQMDVFPTYAEHPIDSLYRIGLSVGVNTDTRATSDITLTREYEKLAAAFGWTAADFLRVNRNALDAAFIPDDLRAGLAERLEAGYAAAAGGS